MVRKFLWRTSLVVGLVSVFLVSAVYAIDQDTAERLRKMAIISQKYALPSDGRAQEGTQFGTSSAAHGGQYLGANSSAGSLGCTPNSVSSTAGLTVGCTYYDYQKNGSMNRQIATDNVFQVMNFTWMNQDNNAADGGRNVRFDAYDPSTGALGDGTGGVNVGGGTTLPDRSGYVTMAGLADGTALNAHHYNPSFPTGIFRTYVFKNNTPGFADFSGYGGVAGTGRIQDSVWASYDTGSPGSGDQFIWPAVAVTDDGGTVVTHLVIHNDNTTNGPGNNFLYTRKIGSSDAWSHGMEFGWGGYLSPVIVGENSGSNVALVWAGGRGDGTAGNCTIDRSNGLLSGQADNDMYYMKSTDHGATWSSCVNVTKRPDSTAGGFAPGSRCTAVFTNTGDLVFAWQAMQWNGYAGPFPYRGRIQVWEETNALVRTAVDANWDPILCNGGVFNLNAAQPQLSECDGKLYLTFSYFAPVPEGRGDDCSTRAATSPTGAANGDIWVTVSSNGGFNWDPKRNLTDSYSPDCDTIPGGAKPDCEANTWHSATRYGTTVVADEFDPIPDLSSNIGGYAGGDYLFVQYIHDSDPGGAIRPEGGWQNVPIRAFRFGCVEPVAAPVIASSIPVGQAVEDPAHTFPGTDSTIQWILDNVGNAPLTYSIAISNDVPAGNVAVTGGDGSIPETALNSDTLALVLNATSSATVQNMSATIVVSGNFLSSPDTFLVDYCNCDLQQRVVDTLDNSLVFDNRGAIANQNNNGQNDLQLEFPQATFAAEADTTEPGYLFDGSPIISVGGVVTTAMFDNDFVDSTSFRPLTDPTNGTSGSFFTSHSGDFTNQDSTLGLSVQMWQKTTPEANTGSTAFRVIYGRTALWNRTGSTINNVTYAWGWDWDVPSDSGARNTSGIVGSGLNYMWQNGSEFGADTGNSSVVVANRRWAAVKSMNLKADSFPVYTAAGQGKTRAGFKGQYTRDNATFVGGDWDHARVDSMLTNITGFSAYTTTAPDSLLGVDLHMVLNAGTYNVGAADTIYLYWLAVTGIGAGTNQSELQAIVDAADDASPLPGWRAATCCDVAGDANNSGGVNIGDATFLIARIFSGGPPPPCCAEGDANGSGGVNIGDATFLIARIFSGGPAPVCGPAGMVCSPE